jgi:hypothetical protein
MKKILILINSCVLLTLAGCAASAEQKESDRRYQAALYRIDHPTADDIKFNRWMIYRMTGYRGQDIGN